MKTEQQTDKKVWALSNGQALLVPCFGGKGWKSMTASPASLPLIASHRLKELAETQCVRGTWRVTTSWPLDASGRCSVLLLRMTCTENRRIN